MSLAPLTDAQRIQMANDIAEASSSLDWLKNNASLSKDQRAKIVEEIRKLHEHAATLAGSRCAEIYALYESVANGSKAEEETHL